jgi:hypothetical protein
MELFENVVLDMLQCDVINELHNFLNEKSVQFSGDDNVDDYSNEDYAIFQEFCNLLESHVDNSCFKLDIDVNDFYDACAQQNSGVIDVFSKILLISSDFLTFKDVMRDSEKRSYMFRMWSDWSRALVSSLDRK